MKKIIAVVLAVILVVGATGCSSGNIVYDFKNLIEVSNDGRGEVIINLIYYSQQIVEKHPKILDSEEKHNKSSRDEKDKHSDLIDALNRFNNSIEFAFEGYTRGSTPKGLKVGDTINVTVTYDEEAAKELGLKIRNAEFTLVV